MCYNLFKHIRGMCNLNKKIDICNILLYYILRFLSINFASRVISAGNIVNIYIKFKSINFRFYYALSNIFYRAIKV